MKVAISAIGTTLDCTVHRQFGRCDWFLIIDDSNDTTEALKNQYAALQTGAGIGCAQDLIREGVEAVITGQVGPKAYEVLNEAGVPIYLAPPGISAHDAYEKYCSKELPTMEIKYY